MHQRKVDALPPRMALGSGVDLLRYTLGAWVLRVSRIASQSRRGPNLELRHPVIHAFRECSLVGTVSVLAVRTLECGRPCYEVVTEH